MLSHYSEEIEAKGFAIIPGVLDSKDIDRIIEQLRKVAPSDSTRQRGESYFGIRNLLSVVPALRDLPSSTAIRSLVDPIAGRQAQVVCGTFFDKTPEANWKVPWHQDLTIAVRQRKKVAGFNSWTLKAGTNHVQPPATVLEKVLALRLHLDATNEESGALKVIPGSHKLGRLSADDIQKIRREREPVVCSVERGDVLAMRPLLLHSSSISTNASHRRVIHLEFCSVDLPSGLEWCLS
jgi:ectoine hydroxylase-related dioxygenase (phytanoyl-CoA dioxygenase family)